MQKAALWFLLFYCAAASATDVTVVGTLEKTDRPGACAQLTDAASDVYYITQTGAAAALLAPFIDNKIKAALTGEVKTQEGAPPLRFLEVKKAEKYESKMPPPPTQEEKNKLSSDAFLAENKKKEGVLTTASGLQYKILKEGNGEKPRSPDKVKVNYLGTTLGGHEFVNTFKKNEPVVLAVKGGFMQGWSQALKLMRVGAKFRFFIPPVLGYGVRGLASSGIGPNEALIFEIELLGIEK
jgi:FKBP-type peptidyl-prolyl cis-trans isomerase FklB